MQCIHKTFYAIRTVFLSIFAFLCISQSVLAANPLYTVEGVRVDITAKSAVEAREQAFEQAQADAFNTLAGRMLPPQQLQSFKLPDINTISAMIQDYEIANEQLSTVRYVADYTIRFKEGASRNYFASLGADIYGAQQAFTDIGNVQPAPNAQTTEAASSSAQPLAAPAGGPVLVLPFLEKGGQMMLWSPFNVWRNAWDKTGGAGASDIVVPLGDISDISDIRDEDALSFNPEKLGALVQRYGASEAVIAIARPDAILSRIANEGDAAAGVLKIALYRTDMGRADYVHDITVTASNTDTLASLFNRGVAQVKRALSADWKNNASAPSDDTSVESTHQMATLQSVDVRIPYASLREWSETQAALRRVRGIASLEIRSVTPREASASLSYNGDIEALRLALAQSGITLDQGGSRGAISVTSGDSFTSFAEGAGQAGTYTVYLNKYR
jgi:hypothetical protein